MMTRAIPAAMARSRRDPRRGQQDGGQSGRYREIDHRIFCEHPRADRPTEHNSPSDRRPLAQMHKGKQRQREAGEHRCVGRGEQTRDGDRRQCRIGEPRDPAHPRAIEPPGDEGHGDCAERMNDRQGQPDPERRITTDRRGQTEDPADQRRLGVIPPGKLLPPEPVLCVIHIEIGTVERQEADPPERDQQDPEQSEAEKAVRRRGSKHGSATGCECI